LLLLFSIVYWENFPYTLSSDSDNSIVVTNNDNSSLKSIVTPQDWDSTLYKISKDYLWTDFSEQSHPIAFYVSKMVNYFLGILAFIAFLVLIYWFSTVFTGKTDEWVKKWGKYLKIAIIAIIIIWVSWLISMWIFSIYNTNVVN